MIKIKIVILGIAIGLVSGQTFQQVQNFPAQTIHSPQREVQPEIHIQSQSQQRASDLNDEVARNFRLSVAQSIRDRQNQGPTNIGGLPADYPVDPLNDPNIPIVQINNQPLRQSHISRPRSRPRLQRIRVEEPLEENEPENIPQAFLQRQQTRIPVPSTPVRQQVVHTDEEDAETARYLRKQAENAHYSFDSSVQDTINDHAISRQEVRDGLALKGMYSYSDGFFRRTVHYEADEHGYRVTKEEIDPIGNGPQYNPSGKADVSSSLIGEYSITADDVRDTRVKNPLRREEFEEPQIRNRAPERKHRFEAGRV
ncbi:uncharacterized protein LOC119071271 [Bradysia coprophila]|uniref:uncharacterized protein LOC119071271 n=1 Tax=Bradysia coprophila TaxID=38358 RepID=UPI00187DAA7A|nr:uncharacterized protein LOC119071271 [Bradysia coprophila]